MTIVGTRFELFVTDVVRSVRFYSEVLGFRAEEAFDPSGYVPIVDGTLTIGLQRHAALSPDHHFAPAHFDGPRGVGVEIVLEVADVDSMYEHAHPRVADLGGHVEPIGDRAWGLRDFRIVDPDGYYLRITSHAEHTP